MDTKKVIEIIQADKVIQFLIVIICSLTLSTIAAFIVPTATYNTLIKYLYNNRIAFIGYLSIPCVAVFWFVLKVHVLNNTEVKKIVKVVETTGAKSTESLEAENEELANRLKNLQFEYDALKQNYIQIEATYNQKVYEMKSDFETELLVKEHEFQEFLEEKLKDRNLEDSRLFLLRCIELSEGFAIVHVLVEKCLLQLMIKLGYDGYEYRSEKDFREALTLARQTNDFGEILVDLTKKFKGKKFPPLDKMLAKITQACSVKFKDAQLIQAMQFFEVPTTTAKIKFNESALMQYLDGIDEVLHLFEALRDDFNYIVRDIVKADKPTFKIPKIVEVAEDGIFDAPIETVETDEKFSDFENHNIDEASVADKLDSDEQDLAELEQKQQPQTKHSHYLESTEDIVIEAALEQSQQTDDKQSKDSASIEQEVKQEESTDEIEPKVQEANDSKQESMKEESILQSDPIVEEPLPGIFKIPRRRTNRIKQELTTSSSSVHMDSKYEKTIEEQTSIVDEEKQDSSQSTSVTQQTSSKQDEASTRQPKRRMSFNKRAAALKQQQQPPIKESSKLVEFEEDREEDKPPVRKRPIRSEPSEKFNQSKEESSNEKKDEIKSSAPTRRSFRRRPMKSNDENDE